jgi:hypothetical protein
MDLTEKYMENQGTLGYLHNYERSYHPTVLAYETEGSKPDYHYCKEEKEAQRILEHWGKTGELVMARYNFGMDISDIHIAHPTQVTVLRTEDTYFRRMYPPYPTKHRE